MAAPTGHGLRTDPATSVRMRRIPQRDTAAELLVKRLFRQQGLHYRTANRDLPGSPDLANRSKRWATFVHGCFWHGHDGCKRATVPKRNREFWLEKFRRNKERDAARQEQLHDMGYRVLVIWECELEEEDLVRRRISRLLVDAGVT